MDFDLEWRGFRLFGCFGLDPTISFGLRVYKYWYVSVGLPVMYVCLSRSGPVK